MATAAESPTPDLTPKQQDQLEHVVESISGARVTGSWLVRSRPGFGQTIWLKALKSRLTGGTILVSPPLGSEDTALAALSQLVDGLHDVGAMNGDRQLIRDPSRPFTDKVGLVAEAIRRFDEELVILVDEPSRWDLNTSEHAQAWVAELLNETLRAATRSLVTGPGVPTYAPRPTHTFDLDPARFPAEELAESDWGVLAPFARETAGWIDEGFRVSPVVFRLLVASHALAEVGHGSPARSTKRLALSHSLWTQVQDVPGLRRAWRALSVLRQSVPQDVALDLIRPEQLDEVEQAIVWRCLLTESGQGVHLPLLLRAHSSAEPHDREPTSGSAHAVVAAHYATLLESSVARPLAAAHERLVHLGLSDSIEELLSEQPMFQEQLHAVGWWLSRQLRRYADAAHVFTRAIEIDETDAYAQHYRAYNLDVLGEQPDVVDRGYSAAVQLHPESFWYWSRLIRFLVTQQRIADAREAWSQATSFLEESEQSPSRALYEDLHAEVARALLQALELDFASEVLADIPESERTEDLAPLFDRLNRLLVARELDQEVYVPLWALTPNWAAEGPFAIPSALDAGQLREWWAARIDGIEDDVALVSAAAVTVGDSPTVEDITTRIPVEDLLAGSVRGNRIRRGAMFEVGWYAVGGDEVRAVQFHSEYRQGERRLSPVFPDPLRYATRG